MLWSRCFRHRQPLSQPKTHDYHNKLETVRAENPPDLAHARIYDRILERCAPILFDGKNFREENAGVTRQAAKDIVNSKHD